jgi:hypothetical protein
MASGLQDLQEFLYLRRKQFPGAGFIFQILYQFLEFLRW